MKIFYENECMKEAAEAAEAWRKHYTKMAEEAKAKAIEAAAKAAATAETVKEKAAAEAARRAAAVKSYVDVAAAKAAATAAVEEAKKAVKAAAAAAKAAKKAAATEAAVRAAVETAVKEAVARETGRIEKEAAAAAAGKFEAAAEAKAATESDDHAVAEAWRADRIYAAAKAAAKTAAAKAEEAGAGKAAKAAAEKAAVEEEAAKAAAAAAWSEVARTHATAVAAAKAAESIPTFEEAKAAAKRAAAVAARDLFEDGVAEVAAAAERAAAERDEKARAAETAKAAARAAVKAVKTTVNEGKRAAARITGTAREEAKAAAAALLDYAVGAAEKAAYYTAAAAATKRTAKKYGWTKIIEVAKSWYYGGCSVSVYTVVATGTGSKNGRRRIGRWEAAAEVVDGVPVEEVAVKAAAAKRPVYLTHEEKARWTAAEEAEREAAETIAKNGDITAVSVPILARKIAIKTAAYAYRKAGSPYRWRLYCDTVGAAKAAEGKNGGQDTTGDGADLIAAAAEELSRFMGANIFAAVKDETGKDVTKSKGKNAGKPLTIYARVVHAVNKTIRATTHYNENRVVLDDYRGETITIDRTIYGGSTFTDYTRIAAYIDGLDLTGVQRNYLKLRMGGAPVVDRYTTSTASPEAITAESTGIKNIARFLGITPKAVRNGLDAIRNKFIKKYENGRELVAATATVETARAAATTTAAEAATAAKAAAKAAATAEAVKAAAAAAYSQYGTQVARAAAKRAAAAGEEEAESIKAAAKAAIKAYKHKCLNAVEAAGARAAEATAAAAEARRAAKEAEGNFYGAAEERAAVEAFTAAVLEAAGEGAKA